MPSFPLVTLVILDGFGCAAAGPGNAVDLAETPVFDRLWRDCPHTTIEASGEAAGLPAGQCQIIIRDENGRALAEKRVILKAGEIRQLTIDLPKQ